ncbi:response regulator [Belliella marina]|uniref:Response regulator n=1 Tax=Belliella marina TaxID=1644146 RepID=A0ABW4VSG8_9BACT
MNHQQIEILLAEDDRDDQLFFKKALQNIPMKLRIATVNDGAELLEYLNTSVDPFPHILFLDINLPKKNGMECLKEIRKKEKLKELSIAMYSSSTDQRNIEEAFVCGANIYITKPSKLENLHKALVKVLTVNWQYLTSGMDRDTFLMSI